MKQTYIRCPRCELNYILKRDKVCNVCKLEMKALGSLAAEENLDLELCPICKTNYINPDEDICSQCAKERELEDGGSGKYSRDDEWSSYANGSDDDADYNDDENGDMVSITNLDDTPIVDDEMDLGIDDDDADSDDDVFDGDDLDDDDLDDDYDDDDNDDFDDEIEEEPKSSKRKK